MKLNSCDLLIVTSPVVDTDKPLQAPAVLKAVTEKHGYKTCVEDINFKFLRSTHKDIEFLKQYFRHGTTDDYEKISVAEDYVSDIAKDLLLKYLPKFIAISVFTYQSQTFALLLAQNLRQLNPDIKIIFGGQGLTTSGIESRHSWAQECKDLGLIDFYIISEGENAIVDVLTKGHGKGINNPDWEQSRNIDDNPYPIYDDYALENYDKKSLMITGSRGCVRHCTFCDIHKHWQRFVYRSGLSIAKEMIFQSKKYGIYDFSFTDSLINGSMKAYRDFIKNIAEHNKTAEHKLTWGGQFIVRGIKSMTAEDWKITKQSGANRLYLGVESGSESVRNHMKKQFSNKDLDEFMEQAYINEIPVEFLMIVGYPTETEQDFQENIKMFQRYKKYRKIFQNIILGSTLGILPGTPLEEELKNDIDMNGGENFWVYNKNPKLDFRERIKRRFLIGDACLDLGYNVGNNTEDYKMLHFLWNIYKNKQKQNLVDMNTSELHMQKYS